MFAYPIFRKRRRIVEKYVVGVGCRYYVEKQNIFGFWKRIRDLEGNYSLCKSFRSVLMMYDIQKDDKIVRKIIE